MEAWKYLLRKALNLRLRDIELDAHLREFA